MFTRYSLSNLYSLQPDQVCIGNQVDPHFFSQLENLYREDMWTSLETEFDVMDSYFLKAQDECELLANSMAVIYHQHGQVIKEPPEETPPNLLKTADYRHRYEIDESFHIVSMNRGEGESDDTTGTELGQSYEPQVATDASPRVTIHNNAGKSSLSLPRTNASHVIELTASEEEQCSNGMAKCLICLNALSKRLIKSCDKDMTSRLSKHNAYMMTKITQIQDYSKEILMTLAESEAVSCSVFNQSFLAAFEGVTLSTNSSFTRFLSNGSNTTKHSRPIDKSTSSSSSSVRSQPAVSHSQPAVSTALTDKALSDSYSHSGPGADNSNNNNNSFLSYYFSPKHISQTDNDDEYCIHSLQPLSHMPEKNAFWGGGKHKLNVLYYCATLISVMSLPGNIYLTPEFLFVMSGVQIPGISVNLSTQRECYSLRHMDSVSIVTNSTLPFITANTLLLKFYNGAKLLYLTPLVVNRTFLNDLLTTIRQTFIT